MEKLDLTTHGAVAVIPVPILLTDTFYDLGDPTTVTPAMTTAPRRVPLADQTSSVNVSCKPDSVELSPEDYPVDLGGPPVHDRRQEKDWVSLFQSGAPLYVLRHCCGLPVITGKGTMGHF